MGACLGILLIKSHLCHIPARRMGRNIKPDIFNKKAKINYQYTMGPPNSKDKTNEKGQMAAAKSNKRIRHKGTKENVS